jgi:glycosyltransferase involved in cell wall biosynthesis
MNSSNKIKIAQVCLDLTTESTGVLTTTVNFNQALACLGYDVTLISFDRRPASECVRQVSATSIPVLPLPGFRRYGFSAEAFWGKWDHLFKDVEMVFVHSLYGYHFDWAVSLAYRLGIKVAVVPHGALRRYCFTVRPTRKRLWLWRWRTVMRRRLLFIVSSIYEFEQAGEFVDPYRVRIIPWPVEPSFFDFYQNLMTGPWKSGMTIDPKAFMFVGRLHPMKRILETVWAFRRLNGRARLLIAGPPSEEISVDDLQTAAGTDWDTNIVYLGVLASGALREHLVKCAALVLLSQGENFGNVVAEAAAVGCPSCVSTDVGTCDFVAAQPAGMVVKVTCDGDISAAIEGLVDDVSLCIDSNRRTIAANAAVAFGGAAFVSSICQLASEEWM